MSLTTRRPDVSVRVERFGPDAAKAALARAGSASPPNARAVKLLTLAMAAGGWRVNGSPLIFDVAGRLVDGRLRLLACIDAGVEFETVVVRDVPDEAFETLDTLRRRVFGDVLTIRREPCGRAVATAVRHIHRQADGSPPGGRAPPSDMLLAFLDANPEIRASVTPALQLTGYMSHGTAIALHYLITRADTTKAQAFVTQLLGAGRDLPFDPVEQFRSTVERLREQGGVVRQPYVLALAIKAWNAHRAGRSLKRLSYSPRSEVYPRIQMRLGWGPLGEYAARKTDTDQTASVSAVLKVAVRRIGPDEAEALLAGKRRNRSVSHRTVAKYSRDMSARRWWVNGQPIKLDRDGALIDGQHRLEAVRRSQATIYTVVVEGLDENAFASLDTGRRRSLAEFLKARGHINTVLLAAACRWLWLMDNDSIANVGQSPSYSELLTMVDDHSGLIESVRRVARASDLLNGSLAAALHYSFGRDDPENVDDFFNHLIDGLNIDERNPVGPLRKQLLAQRFMSHRLRAIDAKRAELVTAAWIEFKRTRNRPSTSKSPPSGDEGRLPM